MTLLNQELLAAAKLGNTEAVITLIARGADIETLDENGRTPLHLAAAGNHYHTARTLLEQKADVNSTMRDEGTPIFDAVANGHDQMVSLLLNYGANPYLTDERDWNLLHWAASENHFSTVELLIRYYPFLINKTKFNGISPLHLVAANTGNIAMAALLISGGASIFTPDAYGDTAIQTASNNHYKDLARYLTSVAMSGYIPTPPRKIPLISQEIIAARIENIHKEIKLDTNYYSIGAEVVPAELNKQKWKTYLYLRKCVLEHRRGESQELMQLIAFLEQSTANKKWMADRLLDKAVKSTPLDFWGAGKHEWLERSLIVDALRRSAGLVPGVQAETEFTDRANIDWLYVQAQLRSPTQYLFFRFPSGSIREGHIGAIKPDLNKMGFSSVGSPGFHKTLEDAFHESSTLASFIIRIHNIFKSDVVSGKKPLLADNVTRFVVDGSATSSSEHINKFRRERLKIAGYDPTNLLLKGMIKVTSEYGSLADYSASPVDSESSDEENSSIRAPRFTY